MKSMVVSSAARRRFSLIRSCIALRSISFSALVGQVSTQAGPFSRVWHRSHLLASALDETIIAEAPFWRTTGEVTTSIVPYGQATTQVLQPMHFSCDT